MVLAHIQWIFPSANEFLPGYSLDLSFSQAVEAFARAGSGTGAPSSRAQMLRRLRKTTNPLNIQGEIRWLRENPLNFREKELVKLPKFFELLLKVLDFFLSIR